MAEPQVHPRIYFIVFAALLVLTGLTVWVATIDMEPFNDIVALTIACSKALLVFLYFMHLRYSSWLTWIFAGAGIYWLGILLVLTLTDYVTRGWTSR